MPPSKAIKMAKWQNWQKSVLVPLPIEWKYFNMYYINLQDHAMKSWNNFITEKWIYKYLWALFVGCYLLLFKHLKMNQWIHVWSETDSAHHIITFLWSNYYATAYKFCNMHHKIMVQCIPNNKNWMLAN